MIIVCYFDLSSVMRCIRSDVYLRQPYPNWIKVPPGCACMQAPRASRRSWEGRLTWFGQHFYSQYYHPVSLELKLPRQDVSLA